MGGGGGGSIELDRGDKRKEQTFRAREGRTRNSSQRKQGKGKQDDVPECTQTLINTCIATSKETGGPEKQRNRGKVMNGKTNIVVTCARADNGL